MSDFIKMSEASALCIRLINQERRANSNGFVHFFEAMDIASEFKKIPPAEVIPKGSNEAEARQMLKKEGVLSDMDRAFIRRRISDALFLVAYVESQLAIDVADEVYDRARELQTERSE